MALLSGTVVVVSGVGPGPGRSIALASTREGAGLPDAGRHWVLTKPPAGSREWA